MNTYNIGGEYKIIFNDPKTRYKMRYTLIKQTNTIVGICEQLRFVYDSVHDLKDKKRVEVIIEKLIDAMIMAKKMNKRLVYYKKTYNDTTGHSARRLVRLQGNGLRLRTRRAREI